MTLYTPLLMEAATGDTALTYHAQDYRLLVSALAPNQGVIKAGDLAVTQRAAGANLSVDVAAGRCIIAGGSIANQGTYICRSDAVTNVPIPTPNATNPRIDLIVAQVHDKQADGGTTYGWTINTVQGVASSSPVAPATPTSALLLAQVSVAANDTSTTTSEITDKRVLSGVGDVPKWDIYGTSNPTGQVVSPNTGTTYVPFAVNQLVGVTHSSGVITIQTPGRYAMNGCIRLTAGVSGACNRITTVVSSVILGGNARSVGNTCTTAADVPVSTSGTFFLNRGDTVHGSIYHDYSASLTVDNSQGDVGFSGVWVGP